MKRFVLGLLVGAAGLAAAGTIVFLSGGLSAREEPSRAEASVARIARRMAMPSSAKEMVNPIRATPENLRSALLHFADHCASCHGNDGSGATPLGRSLYPRSPDLRSATTQAWSDGELFFVIENGIRMTGMPAWGGAGKPEESWKLVHFIRHLPRLTAEERASMGALNPRSLSEWRELEAEERFLRGEPEPQGGAAERPGHHH